MNRVINFLAGFIVAFFIAGCCHTITPQQAQVAVKTKTSVSLYKSVVKLQINVLGDGGQIVATGFAIDKERIATVAHFCAPIVEGPLMPFFGELEMVSLNNNGELAVTGGLEIIAIDEKNDLCLIEKKRHGIVPNRIIDDYESLEIGDFVRVVGGPHGIFPVDTEGKVVMKHIDLDESDLTGRLVISAPCTGGNSGSPVYDKDGNVIGVVTNKGDYDHIVIATTSISLKGFLLENE